MVHAPLPIPPSHLHPPGLLLPSTAMRLQHAADAVFSLQTLSDDSEVFALLPDAARLVVPLAVRCTAAAASLAVPLEGAFPLFVTFPRMCLISAPLGINRLPSVCNPEEARLILPHPSLRAVHAPC